MKNYKHTPKDPEVWINIAIEKVIKTIDSSTTVDHFVSSQRVVENMYDFFKDWCEEEAKHIKSLLLMRIEIAKLKQQ